MVSKTLMAAAIALAGCLAAAPAAAASKIDRVLVVSETTDTLVLEIRYSYDGRQGGRVFATARMTKGGKSLNHYSVRPGAVERGKQWSAPRPSR